MVKGREGTMQKLVVVINNKCNISVNALGFGTLYVLHMMKLGR